MAGGRAGGEEGGVSSAQNEEERVWEEEERSLGFLRSLDTHKKGRRNCVNDSRSPHSQGGNFAKKTKNANFFFLYVRVSTPPSD